MNGLKNYTNSIAHFIVSWMARKKCYSDNEFAVICYGMELFLDSTLKAIIYLLLGIAFGQGVEVLIALLIFMMIRYLTGGHHAETDLGCFFVSGAIIFIAVALSKVVRISDTAYIGISLLICIYYCCFSPKDEYYEEPENRKEKLQKKIQSLCFIAIVLIASEKIGMCWRTLTLCILVGQGALLFDNKIIKESVRNERKHESS